jgi:hypothetical protein
MIKTYTAYTAEIDDVETAVVEIKEQLEDCSGLLKNSIGILTCYTEFIDSGVVEELCRALPFDIVGSTTLGNAVPGSDGKMLLTLVVLSSADVKFSTGLSGPVTTDEDDSPLRKGYEPAASALGEKPALMISFAPLLANVGGDFFVESFDRITGGVPNFGMLAVDDNSDYHLARTIYNGEAYSDRYVFALAGGSVKPTFLMASISPDKTFAQKGVVTSSHGNQLKTVNNVPVVDYLQSVGLVKNQDGTITGINSFPFVVDYNDGTMPVVRIMFATTEEGYAVCGGNIPDGATLSVGRIDANEVISTTTDVLNSAIAPRKPDFILMFSCVGRYFALGYNPRSEIECVKKIMEETSIPYQFTYSGGEICPVYKQKMDESTTNRNHNDTFIMCLL